MNWEFAVLNALQSLHVPLLDKAMCAITKLGDGGLLWIVLCIVLLCFRKTRKAGVCMAIALALGALVANVTLKPLVARVRPYAVQTDVSLLIPPPQDASFPSGHTTSSFAAATALFLHHKKFGAAALGLAGLIGLSRLYLYVHYPTDVLAGALIGVLAAICARALLRRVWPQNTAMRE